MDGGVDGYEGVHKHVLERFFSTKCVNAATYSGKRLSSIF